MSNGRMCCLMNLCLFLAFSDLDRDFWNNNDNNSEQQRWSSYPPKEFVLNISPYAPYGDPRLTLKWVSVQAGKRPYPLPNSSYPTYLTCQPVTTPDPGKAVVCKWRGKASDACFTIKYLPEINKCMLSQKEYPPII